MDGLDILREKWANTFHAHVHEKCGVFPWADIETNFKNVDPDISEQSEAVYGFSVLCVPDMYTRRFGPDKRTSTVDEYVESFAWCFLKRPGIFRKRWRQLYAAVFETVDVDKDAFISVDEFQRYYLSNNKPEEQMRKVFGLLDANGDGQITKKEFVDAHDKYFCDPSVSNKELPLYQG